MSDGREPARACLFATALGTCAVAWRGAVVVATNLPEADEASTLARIAERAGGAIAAPPSQEVLAAIRAMEALLSGEPVDLGFVACDFDAVDPFHARVYACAREIRPGETVTYGGIARRLGNLRLAQAVGRALGSNPWPIIVPCHRVLGAGGRLTGFSANGGIATKLRMLEIERAGIARPTELFGELPLSVGPQAGARGRRPSR